MKYLLLVSLWLPLLAKADSIRIMGSDSAICRGTEVVFTATESGGASPHFQWKINQVAVGTDTAVLVVSTLHNLDSTTCSLTTATGDTVLATSNVWVERVDSLPNAGVILGKDTVCVGATITLADSIQGGLWTATNGYVAISGGVVTGIAGGGVYENQLAPAIDTVLYMVTNLCGTDTARATVYSFGRVSAYLYVGSELCEGQTYDFGELGNNIGNLTASNASVVADSAGGVLRANSAGLDTLVNIVSDGCFADTFVQAVMVMAPPPNPPPIIPSRTSCCVGDTIGLSDAALLTPYQSQWTCSPNGMIVSDYASPATARLVGIGSGALTVTLLVFNACGTAYTTQTDTFTAPLPITPIGIACVSRTLQLEDATGGGLWAVADTGTASIDPVLGTLYCKSSGNASISYTTSDGCYAALVVAIDTLPRPIVVPEMVCNGASLSLGTPGGGKWFADNPALVHLDSVTGLINFASPGLERLTYVLEDGCYDSAFVRVIDCGKDIGVFPNPFVDEIDVEADTVSYNDLCLFDMQGRLLYHLPITAPLFKIATPNLVPGIYILRVTGTNGASYFGKVEKI
jgi:hypothetical protein